MALTRTRTGATLERPEIFGQLDRQYTEPVFLTHQEAYSVTVRLAGSAIDRHTVVISKARYDRQGSAMTLSKVTLEHIRSLPSGDLVGLSELVDKMAVKAKAQTPQMDVEVNLDVTRSPLAWEGFSGDPALFMLATTGLERFQAPYRILGRLLLLSGMQLALRNRRLVIALPATTDDGKLITANRLEQALSNVELKTPKAESEELMLDNTGPDDDLALTTALCLHICQERIISPEDLRYRKASLDRKLAWVI